MSVSVFGVRHHSPGCARSLLKELTALRPDILLLELPPEASALLPLVLHPEMQPPVALMMYAVSLPRYAVAYPFVDFSPEWQALRYALAEGVQLRGVDLPQSVQLAAWIQMDEKEGQGTSSTPPRAPRADLADPWQHLAQAAGYADAELWWEHQVDLRRDTSGLFEALLEIMRALRSEIVPQGDLFLEREAAMRQGIRAAARDGFKRIAVVCGALHAPALQTLDGEREDAALLRKLPHTHVEVAWVPWTMKRMARTSGFGAGVSSPGWYDYVWLHPDDRAAYWMAHVAELLRAAGFDAPPASLIEVIHLSEALSQLRALSYPGLLELQQATEAALCYGNADPLHLIRDQLEIGERQGTVPPQQAVVALQRDLELNMKRLHLPPSEEARELDLDLRSELGLARSRLLHQLGVLDIPWGLAQEVKGSLGTFHERWLLQWRTEFTLLVVEANAWGTTVTAASSARIRARADEVDTLVPLTPLLEIAFLADLPEAISHLIARIEAISASTTDAEHLMRSLVPLARVARYGNVRQTEAKRVLPVIDVLFERSLIGLPPSCLSLDDEAARQMMDSITSLQEGVDLLNEEERQRRLQATLREVSEMDQAHGLVRGRSVRLLVERHRISERVLQHLASLALNPYTPPLQAAAWVEGVVSGSVAVLLHQNPLWLALDSWMVDLTPEQFMILLPALRRGFSSVDSPERKQLATKVKQLREPKREEERKQSLQGSQSGEDTQIDTARAASVLPILTRVLEEVRHGHR